MIGKPVVIISSPELLALRLKGIVGRTGVIVAVKENRMGMFVKLDFPYGGEDEWYIPRESVQLINI